MADDDPSTTSSAADEARAKAEARRQRILKKSSQRMGLVSGEQVKQEPAGEEEVAAAAVESSNASSRMQAMRRRRYKKQQQAKDAPAADKEAETCDAPAAEKEAETPAAVEEPVIVEAPPKKEPVAVAEPKKEKTESSTRKYKGVAAMRRQRLKEKAAKENAATDAADKSIATKLPERKKLAILKLPIIFHLVTILVLFGAGLKLGTDQIVREHVTVHRTLLAPQQHGIGVVNLVDRMSNGYKSADPKTLLEQEQAGLDEGTAGLKDEFGGDDDEDEEYVPNIDPLFQLDLDKFTQGNSIFMYAARFAISLHRLNLYFFYYLPLRVINAVMRIPAKLVQTPPLLFSFCLFVRQFSKRILGAALPEVPSDKKKEDILAMLKQGVMNFLLSSFPTVVEFYDAFTHLRSDMFVLLCGFFVGLAWNHHHGIGLAVGSGEQHDEL